MAVARLFGWKYREVAGRGCSAGATSAGSAGNTAIRRFSATGTFCIHGGALLIRFVVGCSRCWLAEARRLAEPPTPRSPASNVLLGKRMQCRYPHDCCLYRVSGPRPSGSGSFESSWAAVARRVSKSWRWRVSSAGSIGKLLVVAAAQGRPVQEVREVVGTADAAGPAEEDTKVCPRTGADTDESETEKATAQCCGLS